MSLVMVDDEDSDFVANAVEQKLIKGTAANSISGDYAPESKEIAACLRLSHEIAKVQLDTRQTGKWPPAFWSVRFSARPGHKA
jgi:hypothetical protein